MFESSRGDLTEVVSAILDSAGLTVANPGIDPDSVSTQIGIMVPFTLQEGQYTLELQAPTGVLVAGVVFTVGDVRF